MGTFNTKTPKQLVLEPWEETQRRVAIAATNSPSPVPYAPILNVPDVYTHVGHAAQYGKGRRDGRTIRLIILHVTDVDGTAIGAASYDARRPDLVSATAFIGPNGEIIYDVDEANRPYTTQRWNDESIAAEIIGHDEWSPEKWLSRPGQMEGIVKWVVDGCKRLSIPPLWLSPAGVAEGASRHGTPPVQGVNRGITDHLDANLAARLLGASVASTSHVCVGPGLRSVFFATLLPEIVRRLKNQPTPEPIPTPIPDPEEDMEPFLIQKSNGETAVVYGSGKMVGLQGSDIPGFQTKFGSPIGVADSTYADFASKGTV